MSKLGTLFYTLTLLHLNFFGSLAIRKPCFWFWNGKAADFRHTLVKFNGGSPKGNKQKKNVLCANSVEVRCNDSNVNLISFFKCRELPSSSAILTFLRCTGTAVPIYITYDVRMR